MAEQQPKRYWRSLEEKQDEARFLRAAADEFPSVPEPAQVPLPRRDFLKATGFSLAAALVTGCSRAPVEKAIPLLVGREDLVPGEASFYASTCGECSAGCGLLVKVRDGRPIKLEGNPEHPLSRGGLCAVGQASVLGLYDSQRLQHPLTNGKKASWSEIDAEITGRLAAVRQQGRAVRLLSGSLTSPTVLASIAEFLGTLPDARHVVYDPVSHSAILTAHQQTHGTRVLPRWRFDRAEVVASFDTDFLGAGISPVEHTAGWRTGRDLEADLPRLSYHVQFESRLTLTGSKADQRRAVAPGAMGLLLTHLAARIAQRASMAFDADALEEPPVESSILDDLAERLWQARGRSLVISSSQDVREQVLVNFLNHALGNYGSTLDLEQPSLQAQGDDGALAELLAEVRQGKVAALLIHGVNPLFDLPDVEGWKAALAQVPLLVSFAQRTDETASAAQYVCPEGHYLESWDDGEPVRGLVSLTQPAIRPLGDTRSLVETLAVWQERPRSAYDIFQEHWKTKLYPRRKHDVAFQEFWDRAIHDGWVELQPATATPISWKAVDIQPIPKADVSPADSFDLVLYPTVAMGDGRQAYNPWLHELPDPITKITWDNCASLSPRTAERLGVHEGDVVRVQVPEGEALELPAFIQPGQDDGTVAVALGFGSRLSARFANIGPEWLHAPVSVGDNGLVGKNAAPLLALAVDTLRYHRSGVRIRATGKRRELASTQVYNTVSVPERLRPPDGGRRPIAQETTFAAFLKDPYSGVYDHETKEELWPPDHENPGPRWGMVVDLGACTGCSGCVIACQAENNVPVVGRDEIRRNREMHWVRIDRYYSEDESGQLDVVHQPMFCQQCGNAPCETVCPVLATVHSADGLNEQVYNRCIGTRYCANNCPYKGRRFNWFNYARDDKLQNLVLNPDVAVRSRGVMEKCTFCVQRIRGAQIEAKRRGKPVADGEVQTACQQSCPARAIYFGDLNDPDSQVSRMMRNPRRYRVLSELNVRPSVGFLTVVRNREESEGKETQHHG